MFKTIFKNFEVMNRLQKAYKEVPNNDDEEVSKIFFNYYDIDYKNIKNLPLDLENAIKNLQKQGYLHYTVLRTYIATINKSFNSERHILKLTKKGNNYFDNILKKAKNTLIKILITIAAIIATIITFLSDSSTFIMNLKNLLQK